VQWDTSQVFVVSIPDYAFTPFGGASEFISMEMDKYNEFAEYYCDLLGISF
jgi:acyl-CoA thioesterase-1